MAESFPEPPENYTGKHARPDLRPSGREYGRYTKNARDFYLHLPNPGDLETVVSKRTYAELLTHDGTKTYLVHSTTPELARQILREGFKFPGSSDRPNLEHTVIMLAGPDDKHQATKNAYNLAYQYDAGDDTAAGANTAKVIFEIPKPTPADVPMTRMGFEGTHLATADGENIVKIGPAQHARHNGDTLYGIPPARAMGYIDQDTEDLEWIGNPQYERQVSSDTSAALGRVGLRGA